VTSLLIDQYVPREVRRELWFCTTVQRLVSTPSIVADTPSPRDALLNPRNPKTTNSFFFDFNKLSFRARSRQQRPVGARCGQSVQNPVQSFGSNAWLGPAVVASLLALLGTGRLETPLPQTSASPNPLTSLLKPSPHSPSKFHPSGKAADRPGPSERDGRSF
jgi:hypothetical protein